MMGKNDGGSAFPYNTAWGTPGMTLRDWLAGQALNGLAAYPGREGENNKPEHFAKWSYLLADAMIEARNK